MTFNIIMTEEELNEYNVSRERVIEYANNRLDANPDEKQYYSLPLNFQEAKRVIESFDEEVEEA